MRSVETITCFFFFLRVTRFRQEVALGFHLLEPLYTLQLFNYTLNFGGDATLKQDTAILSEEKHHIS